jgi:threonine/homoserine/homoserine lactone efflux protein
MFRFLRYFKSFAPRHTRSGSSLLELVVCMTILSIIVVSLMRVRDQVERSKLASVAGTARLINKIATTIFAATGEWPADVWNSILPPEMEPFLANNIFENDTPLGGRWD